MAALNKLTFYISNSQFVLGSGLKDQVTGSYINDAVLTANLLDSSGVVVTGATAMEGTYVAASDGNYQFQVDGATFNPTSVSFTATLVIDGTYASGAKRFHAEIPSIIKVRNQGTET